MSKAQALSVVLGQVVERQETVLFKRLFPDLDPKMLLDDAASCAQRLH